MSAVQEQIERDIVLPSEVIERRTYTMREACQVTGMPYSTGCELANAGRFPVRVLRVGGRFYIPKVALEELLSGKAA